MTTILIKKKDTAAAPAAGDLTNAAGGTEIAVNTATKRIYTKDSGGNVVELGTNPSAITGNLLFSPDNTLDIGASGTSRPRSLFLGTNITVGSLTSTRVPYASTGGLLVDSANMTFNGTRLTVADLADSGLTSGRLTYAASGGALVDSANLTFDGTNLSLGGGTANGVAFLNGSKVLTTGSALTFDGTNFTTPRTQITTAGSPPASGAGLEILGGTSPLLFAYNRNTSAYLALNQTASAFGWSLSGSDAMVLTSTGLGIGTSSPGTSLDIAKSSAGTSGGQYPAVQIINTNTSGNSLAAVEIKGTNGAIHGQIAALNDGVRVAALSNHYLQFMTNSTERARIDSSGNLLVGTTSTIAAAKTTIICPAGTGNRIPLALQVGVTTDGYTCIAFHNQAGAQGSIAVNTATVSYNTTSDYRLKTVIGPVANAGQRIDALQPVEYTWNASGERTRGFLAHQFQEVYAGSVTGTKDAVDAEGKPVYQSMQASTSEVIADLVAELQSLRARVAALESN